jgi:manganese transport protein
MLMPVQRRSMIFDRIADATRRPNLAARATLEGRSTSFWNFLPFAGPAIVASVGYMDPGNFVTNIQAGSTYGYQLLWVVLIANLVAMLFQSMSAKLGIVTGRNLAELCRREFPRPVAVVMWIASEIAAIATDLAEFLGGALGISLMLHVPLLYGMGVTGLVTLAILTLQKRGFRPLELVIAALVTVIGLCYLYELAITQWDWHAALFHVVVPQLHDRSATKLAVAIVGATIMPHTLYLHSSLTQDRKPARNDLERRRLVRCSNRESLVALGFAGLVNLAMVVMAAAAFSKSQPGLSDMGIAYHTLVPALGVCAGVVFLISLTASGISSSVVGTMAGQVIMQGFVGFGIPVWLRRVITMAPAFVVGLRCNTANAMIFSQVVLSLVLPLPMIALVVLSSRKSIMGNFVMGRSAGVAAAIATVVIVLLNAVLLMEPLLRSST